MKQNYIQKIREKCIEANKSILDLKFGCELKSLSGEIVTYIKNKETDKERIKRIRECGSHFRYDTVCLKDNGSEYLYAFNDESKIIGRPIHLADVLLAIEETEHYIQIDGAGGIKHKGKIEHFWNLKETLENQSEETLKFIADLLDNK